MPSPRVLAPDAASASGDLLLGHDEARHLTRVLRLGTGAEVRLFDGAGREWRATIRTAGRDGVRVSLEEELTPVPEPPVAMTLAIGLLKGAQMDSVVRDATALGVAAIVPLETAHVAVGGAGRRSAAATARWRRVAVASAKQCGRAVVPEVRAVESLEGVLGAARRQAVPVISCVEPSAGVQNGSLAAMDAPAAATVCIGPEGGWSNDELDLLRAGGAVMVSIGPRTLRAETVPVVVLSALWARWGW